MARWGTPPQIIVFFCVVMFMIIAVIRGRRKPPLPQVGEIWLFTAGGPWGKTYQHEILELKAGWVRYVQINDLGQRVSTEDSSELESFLCLHYRRP